jgi:hypothetical protein
MSVWVIALPGAVLVCVMKVLLEGMSAPPRGSNYTYYVDNKYPNFVRFAMKGDSTWGLVAVRGEMVSLTTGER